MVFQRFSWKLCLSFIVAAGCGEEPGANVRGRVTHKGSPVVNATVVFYPSADAATRPKDGRTAYGNLDSEGRFVLLSQSKTENITPGTYVAFLVEGGSSEAQMREDPSYREPPKLPLEFRGAAESPLKFDVKLGPNEFDINLDNYKSKNSK